MPPAAAIPGSGGFVSVDPRDLPDWDRQVAALPGAGFFHTSAWARVLAESYGYEPRYLIRRDGDRLAAVLPLMEVSSWLTGRRAVSLPFTDAVEPLGFGADAIAGLLAEARRLAAESRWKYVEFRGGRTALESAPPATHFHQHMLALRADADGLFAGLDESMRRAVRKAERAGLVIEFSTTLDAMREFYGLFCQTRRKHGAPPQPFHFFANVRQHVIEPGQGWIVLARIGGRPVAGAIYFHSGRAALYKFGGSDARFLEMRGNNLVMWSAIAKYAREGFATLDFGRTSVANEGLRRFKASWGAAELPLDYWRYEISPAKFVVVPDRASGRQVTLFRNLPVPISRLFGQWAYRHIG